MNKSPRSDVWLSTDQGKDKEREKQRKKSSGKSSFRRSPESVLNKGKLCCRDRLKPLSFPLIGASGWPLVLLLQKSSFRATPYLWILISICSKQPLCQRSTFVIGIVCLLQKLSTCSQRVGSPMCWYSLVMPACLCGDTHSLPIPSHPPPPPNRHKAYLNWKYLT